MQTEIITIENDIVVMGVTAESFPDGIIPAYEKLRSIVGDDNRKYFGISHPVNGVIFYRATTEVLEGDDAEKLGLETFTIRAGRYNSVYIVDHMKDAEAIPNAFDELLKTPNLDPQGYCLEWYKDYLDIDVKCMVPLLD